MLRINNSELKMTDPMTVLDFRGWTRISWDLQNDAFQHFTGEATEMSKWRFDSFLLKHEWTDEDDDSVPYQEWTGEIYFNGLEYNKWDNTATQTASVDDITLPEVGVESIATDNNAPVRYYNLQGVEISKPANGIFIRVQGSNASKVMVK